MPAMAAFMDQSFSSTVLEGASRQKNKHDGLEEQPQTISFFFLKHEILKIQIVATQKRSWIPQNTT